MACSMDGWNRFTVSAQGSERPVFDRGEGPAVVVLHELPGLSPDCVSFANRLVRDGFHIFLPLLFGDPCQHAPNKSLLKLCVSKEFHFFATGKTSPISNWLRGVCSEINRRVDGRGVGVVGLCLTGGLALVLIAEPAVVTAVSSEPAIPFPAHPGYKADLGISEEDLSASRARTESENRRVLALRFSSDALCTTQRFTRLSRALGQQVDFVVIQSPDPEHNIRKTAHAVLTKEYSDEPDHPTFAAYQRVVDFLRTQMSRA
jgi:dienelactone hydrolase